MHAYRALQPAEMRALLTEHASVLAEALPADALSDPEVIATIVRLIDGNFRLVLRLLEEIVRIFEVNQADQITLDAIDRARETLVIGTA